METTAAGWKVIDRAAGVLAYNYAFAKQGTAWTFAARMADGKLVVVSPAVGVTEAAFAELEAFGPVGAIVANNGFHHMGMAAWRARFPDARAFAPPDAFARIAKKQPAAGKFLPLADLAPMLGPDVGVRVVPNTKVGESWFWARTGAGAVWYASDVLANLPTLPPKFPVKQLFKWTGSAPGFRVFNLAMKFIVKDKAATLRLLGDDLAAHPPTTIVPAHGDLVVGDDVAARTTALLAAAR